MQGMLFHEGFMPWDVLRKAGKYDARKAKKYNKAGLTAPIGRSLVP